MRRKLTPQFSARKFTVDTIGVGAAALLTAGGTAPYAAAAPAPDVEYVYNVVVRRHHNVANPTEAVAYGFSIWDKVGPGETYAQAMSDMKNDVVPNDEFAANYLVSYAVHLLCPAPIWQLRNSAAPYRLPPDNGA